MHCCARRAHPAARAGAAVAVDARARHAHQALPGLTARGGAGAVAGQGACVFLDEGVLGDAKSSHWVTLRARWVTLRARWVTLRARWVTLRARWVTLRAR
jgi:hypothetical protein